MKYKINALFSDFDGTLSPINVPREKADISKKIKIILEKINKLIPVAIITTKDCDFIRKRMSFIKGIAGISNLEFRINNKIYLSSNIKNKINNIKEALKYAKSEVKKIDKKIVVEEKKASNNKTIAFCVDWRETNKNLTKKMKNIIKFCKKNELNVSIYKNKPYIDIFPIAVSKKKAFIFLKKKLKAKKPILYMGDSIVDNPVFKIADISIGVLHKESDNLKCDYLIKFENVDKFLEGLLKNDLILK